MMMYSTFLPQRKALQPTWIIRIFFLPVIVVWMTVTDGVPQMIFPLTMAVSIFLIFCFFHATCRIDTAKSVYYCVRAFILGEFTASFGWQIYYYSQRQMPWLKNPAANVVFVIVTYGISLAAAYYVEHTFGLPTDEIKNHTAGDTVLLFPYKNYGIAKTAADELKEVKKISWKEPRIRELLFRIPEAFRKLNEAGYLNMDFDFSHLYIRDDKSIMFEYTNLMMPLKATPAQGREALCRGEYPYEFAEPALVQGTLKLPDLDMQNYSLTAMLFYLMIGRMPYDGPLLLGLTDNNEVEHEHRYEVYHKTPVFIFDPQDSSNHLGEFAADQKVIDLWEELPEQIRELFTQTLTQQNALRKREVSNPSPAQWLECLQLL